MHRLALERVKLKKNKSIFTKKNAIAVCFHIQSFNINYSYFLSYVYA